MFGLVHAISNLASAIRILAEAIRNQTNAERQIKRTGTAPYLAHQPFHNQD